MGLFAAASIPLILLVVSVKSQNEEELAVVTAEMFTLLQAEVNDLYGKYDNLQVELQNLAASIQNLATDTAVVGSVELAELQVLIDASNKQEGDIGKLIYSNGIWQQNFRVINSTFERLRKVVVFPIPTINNPSVQASTVRRIIPSIQGRKNLTILKIPVTPKKKLNSRIKS